MSLSSSTENSSPIAGTAARLARAFDVMAGEAERAHDAIARRLGRRRVRIRVDDEAFDVVAVHGAPQVTKPEGDALVTIETSRALVRSVLAGRVTLAEGLRTDALRARGALRDLVAVLSALEAFVHGAVRCAAMPELFDDFQRERS